MGAGEPPPISRPAWEFLATCKIVETIKKQGFAAVFLGGFYEFIAFPVFAP